MVVLDILDMGRADGLNMNRGKVAMEQNYQVVFTGQKQVELRETKIPAPGPGQVLIKSVLTQVSTGTELTILIG